MVFILLGIPLLLGSQFTDVYHFLRHTFMAKQQCQEKKFERTITLADFTGLLNKLDDLVDRQKVYQMKAVELIVEVRSELKVVDNFMRFIFGYAPELSKENVGSFDLR